MQKDHLTQIYDRILVWINVRKSQSRKLLDLKRKTNAVLLLYFNQLFYRERIGFRIIFNIDPQSGKTVGRYRTVLETSFSSSKISKHTSCNGKKICQILLCTVCKFLKHCTTLLLSVRPKMNNLKSLYNLHSYVSLVNAPCWSRYVV